MDIKVLGKGCALCDRLKNEIMEVVNEMGIVANIEHIKDIDEIARYEVMGTPALVINEEVKSVGKVPSKAQLIRWLKEAAG